MKRLQDFFEEERNREPVISTSQIDDFLKAHGHDRAHVQIDSRNTITSNKESIMITAGLGVFAAALIGFLSWNAGSPDREPDQEPNQQTQIASVEEIAYSIDGTKWNIDRFLNPMPEREQSGAAGCGPSVQAADDEPDEKEPGDKGDGKKEGDGKGDRKGSDGIFVEPAPFIAGIRMIELTRDELAPLGLLPDTAGVGCINRTGGNISGMEVTMWGVRFFDGSLGFEKKEVSAPSCQPVLITDDFGNRRAELFKDDDYQIRENEIERQVREIESQMGAELEPAKRYELTMQLNEKLSEQRLATGNFIPVIVRTGRVYTDADKASQRWRPDCIFWYEPSPEFLAALPTGVRQQLERELRLASLLQDKPEHESMNAFIDRQSSDVQKAFESMRLDGEGSTTAAVAGEIFVGALASMSGAITASSVSPNPARDRLIVSYTLTTPRSVSLALYDVNGRHVQTFPTVAGGRSGENLDIVELKDVPPGMYLLVISTEKERAIQRVIVE